MTNLDPATGPRTKLQWALFMAARGFRVFPLTANKKTPAVKGWQDWATTDEAKIGEHWADHPDHNYGVSTANLIVVDVDRKNGKDGGQMIIKLELEGFELPDTFEVDTPSGGQHSYFNVEQPVKQGTNVLGKGVDIRSRGGYVVGPGSTTDQGTYAPRKDLPTADAPQWLIDRCGNAGPAQERSAREVAAEVAPDVARDRAIRYLQREAPQGAEGGRNDAGYKVAARLKDIGVKRDDCAGLMALHWSCEPMLDPDELDHVVNSAFRYGANAQGSASPEAEFDTVALPEKRPPRSGLRKYSPAELLKLPEPIWLVDGLIPEDSLTELYGPPKAGKTFFALGLSLSVATGQLFHGKPVKQGRVAYVAAEGGAPRISARVEAWRKHNGVSVLPEDEWMLITGRAPLDSPQSVDELLKVIGEGNFELIVIDTLARSMTGDENSQKDMSKFVDGCDHLREVTGATVLVIHHEGKDPTKGGRGSTALRAAIDTGIRVRPDGQHIKLSIEDQRDAECGSPEVLELVSVDLGNSKSSAALRRVVDEFPKQTDIDQVLEIARGMDGLKFTQLLPEVAHTLKVSEPTARRRIKAAIPVGADSATLFDDTRIWFESDPKNPSGAPKTIRCESCH